MRRFLFILLACGLASAATGQTWSRYSVGNGVTVLFPTEPKYEVKSQQGQNLGTYISKTQNCLFMTLVQFQAIPRYADFVKLKASDREKIIGQYLDNFIRGKLAYTNAESKAKVINVGPYQGREMAYNAVNPATGQEGKRFTKAIMVNDRLISFECWHLTEGKGADAERVKYFSSIISK